MLGRLRPRAASANLTRVIRAAEGRAGGDVLDDAAERQTMIWSAADWTRALVLNYGSCPSHVPGSESVELMRLRASLTQSGGVAHWQLAFPSH